MRAIAILVVTLTLLFLGGQAKAEKSLGELKVDCEELENFWRLYPPTKDSTRIPGQAAAAICFGYMDAIIGLRENIGILSAPDQLRPNSRRQSSGRTALRPHAGHLSPEGQLLQSGIGGFPCPCAQPPCAMA